MDDSLLSDTDIASNFSSTCAFLDSSILGGMKFTFAEQEVDYLGFRLTKEGSKATADFLLNVYSIHVAIIYN